jgi:hypothetical protein
MAQVGSEAPRRWVAPLAPGRFDRRHEPTCCTPGGGLGQPHLRELPVEPFRYYQYSERTVHLDGCVEVDAAYYGAPPGWIGRRLQVQWDGVRVRLVDPKTRQLLREHLKQERGRHRICDEDRPSRTPQTTEVLLHRARAAGQHIGAVCDQIHRQDGERGVRRILGVLSLAKKHGVALVDDAAKAALELGAPNYRFLRRYLERRAPAPLTLRQVDPLIRQLSLYRELIQRKTRDDHRTRSRPPQAPTLRHGRCPRDATAPSAD